MTAGRLHHLLFFLKKNNLRVEDSFFSFSFFLLTFLLFTAQGSFLIQYFVFPGCRKLGAECVCVEVLTVCCKVGFRAFCQADNIEVRLLIFLLNRI